MLFNNKDNLVVIKRLIIFCLFFYFDCESVTFEEVKLLLEE